MSDDLHSVGAWAVAAIESHRRAVATSVRRVRREASSANVHRLRVAVRRLSVAIDLLREHVGESLSRRSRRALRRMLHRLGGVRDVPQQRRTLARLRASASRPASTSAGLDRLELRLTQQLEKRLAKLPKTLSRFEASKVPGRLARWVRRQRESMASMGNSASAATKTVTIDAASAERIEATWAAMMAASAGAIQGESANEIHRMRIAAKRLRYWLEVLEQAGVAELAEAVSALTQVQAALGRVHDADVWMAGLPIFMEKERRRARRYLGDEVACEALQAGVTWLMAHRRRVRWRKHRQFVAIWTQAVAARRWEYAREVLEQHVGSASDDVSQGPNCSEDSDVG